jgi:hypothetical protein
MSDKLDEAQVLKAWFQRDPPRCRGCGDELKGGSVAHIHMNVRGSDCDGFEDENWPALFVMCERCSAAVITVSIPGGQQPKSESKPDAISAAESKLN